MTVPKARVHPVLGRYRLRRLRIPVKDGRLSIVAVQQPDQLLATIDEAEFAQREQMPYWAEVWPASVALARWLCRGPLLVGRQVLDLGCGLGVAGAAAHRAGAAVCFADWVEDALAFASFNAEQNTPAEQPRPPVEVRLFDWLQDELDASYDLILLADGLYETRNHAPLLALCDSALAAGGCAVIADPYRATADAFFQSAAERFACSETVADTWFPDRRRRIRLLQLRHR